MFPPSPASLHLKQPRVFTCPLGQQQWGRKQIILLSVLPGKSSYLRAQL